MGYALGVLLLVLICKYFGSWGWVIDLSGAIDSVLTGVLDDDYISVGIVGIAKGVVGVIAGTAVGGWVYGNKSMTGVRIISIYFIVCNVLLLAFWRNDYPMTLSSIGEIGVAIYFLVVSFRDDDLVCNKK